MTNKIVTGLLFFCLCVTFPAHARQETPAKPLTEEQQKILKDIETYFNGIKTIKSRFYQTSNNGASAEGSFYVLKPNRMRLEYAPPMPIEVIADGYYLIFHDKKLEQVTYLDLEDNPASLILKENFSFAKEDLTVTDISKEPGYINISLIKNSQPTAGKITLVFKDKPLTLRQWQVTDAQQIVTLVTLDNVEFNIPVDEKMFKFKDPKKDARPGDMPRRNR